MKQFDINGETVWYDYLDGWDGEIDKGTIDVIAQAMEDGFIGGYVCQMVSDNEFHTLSWTTVVFDDEDDEDDEESKTRYVDVIASGYEWICPDCEHFNREVALTEIVECENCEKTFETLIAHHAYD